MDLSLTEELFKRAGALSRQAGRKARIVLTDRVEEPLLNDIMEIVNGFAEVIPVNTAFAKENFARYKGYRDDACGGNGKGKTKIERVDQTLGMMYEIFGITENEILPFISASLEVQNNNADAVMGGMDAPTEAFIAGCSLVLDHGTPSGIFFTETKRCDSIGFVQQYSENVYEVTLPDSRVVEISYPCGECCASSIVEAANEASKKVIDPVVAFISFSTNSSAINEKSEMMKKASLLYSKERSSNLCFGDIQLDASLDRNILLKKMNGCDPFMGRCANCLVYPDATSAHSFIDYFEWAYGGYEGGSREGDIIAIADMAIKPDPGPRQLAEIIADSASTYKMIAGKEPCIALISHDGDSEEKFRGALDFLPEDITTLLCGKKTMELKSALSRADLFIYSELAHGNPAYKAWQILNPGFFITQGFARPVCDLSRGDSYSEKLASTIAYLAIRTFS